MLGKTGSSCPSRKLWDSQCCTLWQHINDENTDALTKTTIKKVTTMNYTKYWQNKINNEAKMRSYNTFKTNFEYEDYLNIKNEKYRKSLTRF